MQFFPGTLGPSQHKIVYSKGTARSLVVSITLKLKLYLWNLSYLLGHGQSFTEELMKLGTVQFRFSAKEVLLIIYTVHFIPF